MLSSPNFSRNQPRFFNGVKSFDLRLKLRPNVPDRPEDMMASLVKLREEIWSSTYRKPPVLAFIFILCLHS